ncbi:MAG: hypothetical protein KGI35_04135 [Burkholderiales bacterium]|nr:hypothetical protein [Burkholderiales bacterium]
MPALSALIDSKQLAGSAMGFEQGWLSLHQLPAARPDGVIDGRAMSGAQSDSPFDRRCVRRRTERRPPGSHTATHEPASRPCGVRPLLVAIP